MTTQPNRDIRPGMSIALGMVVGMIVSKTVEKNLASTLGEWQAFGVSLLVGAAAAGLMALVVYLVMKRST